MALTRSLVRAFALQSADRLGAAANDPLHWPQTLALETVQQTNDYIADNHGEAGMFATLFFGILDAASGRLTYINGGHEPPLFLRSGHPVSYLKATGLAVGALPAAPFRTESIKFYPGRQPSFVYGRCHRCRRFMGEHFSKQRLVSLVSETSDAAQNLLSHVIAALNAHVGKASPADDVTLLILRKTI